MCVMTVQSSSPAPAGSFDLQGMLTANDAAAFEVLNPEGTAPLLFVCDHASDRVPERLENLGLRKTDLSRHIAIDIGAAAVTRGLSDRLNAPAVLCAYSRLVIDCNRHPGDPTSIPAVSDNTPIPGNCDLSEIDMEARAEAIFWPYHKAIGDVLAHMWRRQPQVAPVIVAMHSFTPCMSNGGGPRPWHIGLLYNRDLRLFEAMKDVLGREAGLVIGDNQPYSGREIAYTTERHAAASGLAHVGIELRQDLITEPGGQDVWVARLAAVFDDLLGQPDLHRPDIV